MSDQITNTLIRDDKLIKDEIELLKKQVAALTSRVNALENPRTPRPSLYQGS